MKKFIRHFTDKEILNYNEIIQFRSEFYLVKKGLKQILKQTKHIPASIGIFLGKNKKFFHPSPYLLNLLAKNTKKTVKLNEKGEWMFICSRNIHEPNITKKNPQLKSGDFTLVLNKHNECLGYARFTDNEKAPLENIFDLGNFLRRERKK